MLRHVSQLPCKQLMHGQAMLKGKTKVDLTGEITDYP